jgi:hypothetical protein
MGQCDPCSKSFSETDPTRIEIPQLSFREPMNALLRCIIFSGRESGVGQWPPGPLTSRVIDTTSIWLAQVPTTKRLI